MANPLIPINNPFDFINKNIKPKRFNYTDNKAINYQKTKATTNVAHHIVEQRLANAKKLAQSRGDNPDNIKYVTDPFGRTRIENTKPSIIGGGGDLATNYDAVSAEDNNYGSALSLDSKPSWYQDFLQEHPGVKTAAGIMGAASALAQPTGGGKAGIAMKLFNSGLGYLAGKGMVSNPSSIADPSMASVPFIHGLSNTKAVSGIKSWFKPSREELRSFVNYRNAKHAQFNSDHFFNLREENPKTITEKPPTFKDWRRLPKRERDPKQLEEYNKFMHTNMYDYMKNKKPNEFPPMGEYYTSFDDWKKTLANEAELIKNAPSRFTKFNQGVRNLGSGTKQVAKNVGTSSFHFVKKHPLISSAIVGAGTIPFLYQTNDYNPVVNSNDLMNNLNNKKAIGPEQYLSPEISIIQDTPTEAATTEPSAKPLAKHNNLNVNTLNKNVEVKNRTPYRNLSSTTGISNTINAQLGTHYTDRDIQRLANDGIEGPVHKALRDTNVFTRNLEQKNDYKTLLNDPNTLREINRRLNTHYNIRQFRRLATDNIYGRVHQALQNMMAPTLNGTPSKLELNTNPNIPTLTHINEQPVQYNFNESTRRRLDRIKESEGTTEQETPTYQNLPLYLRSYIKPFDV